MELVLRASQKRQDGVPFTVLLYGETGFDYSAYTAVRIIFTLEVG